AYSQVLPGALFRYWSRRQENAYHLLVFLTEDAMRRQIVLSGLLAFGALFVTVAAFQQPPKPAVSAIKVTKLKDNLFVLNALAAGGGGNTSVFITNNGVVVVDSKNPGWGQPLLEKIKTLTSKPVTMIINT